MPIIVKDILSLQTTKNFTLIAGQSGLGRIIETVDILDYAWEQDRQFSRKLFKPKSFPLSSLQFAKDNPEYLLAVISHLIECGVSGIAYKPVYYYDLPTEIRDLANSCNFPIFRIENGDFLYLETTLGSILNGLGKTSLVFFQNLAGDVIRILAILFLVPVFGIRGYLYGILASELTIMTMALLFLHRESANGFAVH